jgi:uncharacterized protein YndB with AHSA1/START domain
MTPLQVRTEMLIRKPVAEVFEAFIDPTITSHFWFTKGSGRLEQGKTIHWEWEMYGVGTDVVVKAIEPNQRILIEWDSYSGRTDVEWVFTARGATETFVTITESSFDGADAAKEAMESTGGFTMVLCGLKAYLEHGIDLNLIADKAPDANVKS